MPLEFLDDASAPSLAAPVISATPPSAVTADPPATTPAAAGSEPSAQPVLADADRPRGADGRFLPRAGDPPLAAPASPAAAPAPAVAAPGGQPAPAADPQAAPDPIADAIKAAEDRIRIEMEDKYGKQISGLTSTITAQRAEKRQARQPATPPEHFAEDDIEFLNKEVGEATLETAQQYQSRLANQSFAFAAKEYGQDVTDAAKAWAAQRCRADPDFNQQLLESDHPAEIAVKAYQSQQLLGRLTDPDNVTRLLALLDGQQPANPGAPAPSLNPAQPNPNPAPAPPRSILAAPSAGGVQSVPVGAGQAFEATFNR